MVVALDRFGTVIVLSTSTYDHFHLIVKHSHACDSKRLKTQQGILCEICISNSVGNNSLQ